MKRLLMSMCALLLACIMVCSLISCGESRVLMTLDEKTLSVNVYEFLLSRMKGTLGYYGYDVSSESFWRTVVSSDGTTYDDYFCEQIKREAAFYLIASELFDEYGLTLSDKETGRIDELMASHEQKAGSRASLNEKLKTFGVNYDMLREIYVMESKIQALKKHLYGDGGELISDSDKQSYLLQNYVCFEQIFIATYYYVTDEDRFGDTVYYTDKTHKAIAYDKQNGKTAKDETGKIATDIFGDPEYYTADGKIAYDTVNGVIGYLYEKDDKGNFTENRVIEKYSDADRAKLYDSALEYAEVCNKNEALFEQYANEYGTDDTKGTMYLFASAGYYASLNDAVAYFDDIAKKLAGMEVGECAVVSSEYGYHVICKKDVDKNAYKDSELAETFFTDFGDNVTEYLWSLLCSGYLDDVVTDEDVLASAPNMREVGINLLY